MDLLLYSENYRISVFLALLFRSLLFEASTNHFFNTMEQTVLPRMISNLLPGHVIGGMPMVTISDFYALRLELISVFLLGMVISAVVVQKVWNSFRQDFPSLPVLTFPKASVLVTLWGLLFVIVLTMISGARELMTPGAWARKGNTYVLSNSQPEASGSVESSLRRYHLELIHQMLLQKFPEAEPIPARKDLLPLSPELWIVPDTFGLHYLLIPELTDNAESPVLLAEPEFFADGRYVLWQDGRVELIPPGNPMPYKQHGEESP